MDSARDAGIVAVAFIVAVCLIVFLLQVDQPTGRLVDFLFPQM
jgi:hypothetical protein